MFLSVKTPKGEIMRDFTTTLDGDFDLDGLEDFFDR